MALLVDPFPALPPEITLQILDHVSALELIRLEQCSKAWRSFIDQNPHIWAEKAPSTAPFPILDSCIRGAEAGSKTPREVRLGDTLDRGFYDVQNWEDYVKQRTRLLRNWRGESKAGTPDPAALIRPVSPGGPHSQSARRASASYNAAPAFWRVEPRMRRLREAMAATYGGSHGQGGGIREDAAEPPMEDGVYSRSNDCTKADESEMYKLPGMKQSAYDMVENRLVWRFRPDFEDRFIITTAQHGGVQVIDMDDSRELWKNNSVQPFAHLEYDKGYAVWNDDAEGLEIWKKTHERGHLEQVTVLRHTHQIRGFHLTYPTLCVVATDGWAFVYDISTPPGDMLQQEFPIEDDARGHLYQYEDVVAYCFETKGYHFHEKATGARLGVLDPSIMAADLSPSQTYHIQHDFPPVNGTPRYFVRDGPHETYAQRIESAVTKKLTTSVWPESTPLRYGSLPDSSSLRELDVDEWGAAVLWYNWMVCISRGGRLLLCSDWRGALQSAERAKATTIMIECHKSGLQEDFRFDFGGWLSVNHGRLMWEIGDWVYILHLPLQPGEEIGEIPIWCIAAVADAQFSNPISFMGMYEDCLMTTYTTLKVSSQTAPDGSQRLTHSKTIRVASFVPSENTGSGRQ